MLTPIQSRKYARLVNEFNEKEFNAYYKHLLDGKTVEDFFDRVEKHGDHDQSSHGNWATGEGDFQDYGVGGGGDYDATYATYSEKYGVDAEGNVVGLSMEETQAIETYTTEGYKAINSMLRAGDSLYDVTQQQRIEYIGKKGLVSNRAMAEWRKENDKPEDSALTPDERYKAYDSYATKNANAIDSYVLEIREFDLQPDDFDTAVSALDSAIAQAPVVFGDKNLYRAYSDNVLSNMKEGDIIIDKGYLSTTRLNLTTDSASRAEIGNIRDSKDTVAVILPNEKKNGRGFSVDFFGRVTDNVSGMREREKEVLLPRSTPLKFLGYKTDVGNEARVAVFQRMDK